MRKFFRKGRIFAKSFKNSEKILEKWRFGGAGYDILEVSKRDSNRSIGGETILQKRPVENQ